MSTDFSGVDPGQATDQSVGTESTEAEESTAPATDQYPSEYPPGTSPPGAYPEGKYPPGAYQVGTYPPGAYAQAPAQTRPPFWRRPIGIALITLAAVGFVVVLGIGLMVLLAFRSAAPLENEVLSMDYAVEDDEPMIVEEGLSWDQSNGTLNLYPTSDLVERLYFTLPITADALRVDATLIEPAYAGPAPMWWGIELYNSSTDDGVMLMCSSGGTMFLVDSRSRQPLPLGDSDFACVETMDMSLQVDGGLVLSGPNPNNVSIYSGDRVYGGLDTAAVVVAAEQPDQVLRVSKIAVYQR